MSDKRKHKLMKLCHQGNIESLEAFIAEEYTNDSWKCEKHDKSGDSLLHIAVRCGYLRLVEWLVREKTFSLSATNRDGKHPLHEAAQFSQIHCLRFLLNAGAQVDSLKKSDWTPLMLACTKQDIEIVKCLVDAGANIQLKNKDGWNSFHIACREGNCKIISYLLKCDKHLWKECSKNGRTPLHTAALHGHLDVVDILLKEGEYPADVVDSCGSTPLMDALRSGYVDIAEMLTSLNMANLNKEDRLGRTALHLAAQVGCCKSVRWLICNRGVNVNTKSSITGITPLHLAAKEGQCEMLSLLCCLGADVNMTDNKGRTALHQACGGQFADCIQLLFQHGAVDKPDHNHVTASSLANNKDSFELVIRNSSAASLTNKTT